MIIDPLKETKGRQKAIRRKKKARRRLTQEPGSKRLMCTIYAICDEAGMIRYIGQTRTAVNVRIKFHLKQGSIAGKWMKTEKAAGRNVDVKIISDAATWNVSEVIWIERAKACGHQLLNRTRGGNETSIDAVREDILEQRFRLKQCITFL